jgi:hypothetical protein
MLGMEKAKGSKASTGFIVREGALQRGTTTRQLEPPATYRLGILRELSGGETPLDGKIFPEWS